MKKLIFICTALSSFASTSPMNKQLIHPCLPLEFYKHAFGWIAKDAQSHPELKAALRRFINERSIYLKHFERDSGEYYARLTELPTPPSEHALKMGAASRKASKRKEVAALWHYGCVSGDMVRFAIRKNLGVEYIRNPRLLHELWQFETWPMKQVSDEEYEAAFGKTYSKASVLKPAMLVEEKTAHKIMAHFLEHPQVILEKHVAHRKN